MEKPVATDSSWYSKSFGNCQACKSKKTQCSCRDFKGHYQSKYIDLKQRIDSGAIGQIRSGQVYWNDAGVWVKKA
jgi:predicted dehydrogenase